MLKERGVVNWYKDLAHAMENEGWTYAFRIGVNKPKVEPLYVYFLIGGKVKLRCQFVMYDQPASKQKTFDDGRTLKGSTWAIMTGPMVRAKKGQEPLMKGFQGFRYSPILF